MLFQWLASAFASIKHFKASNSISIHIKELLKSEVVNRIDFVNEIMLNRKRNKGEARVHNKLFRIDQLVLHQQMGKKSCPMMPY